MLRVQSLNLNIISTAPPFFMGKLGVARLSFGFGGRLGSFNPTHGISDGLRRGRSFEAIGWQSHTPRVISRHMDATRKRRVAVQSMGVAALARNSQYGRAGVGHPPAFFPSI